MKFPRKADDRERKIEMEREARQLLSWPNACGTYLGRLAKQFPHRVSSRGLHETTHWKIMPATPAPASVRKEYLNN